MGRCCGRQISTPASPLILGLPDGTPARHVQALVSLPGLPAQQWAWVTGSDVGKHIDAQNIQE